VTFQKNDKVTWSTWSSSKIAVHHQGHVVAVIPAGMLPYEVDKDLRGVASTCIPRAEESYVCYDYGKLYWPRTKSLFPSSE
jgi:hypothetical protein